MTDEIKQNNCVIVFVCGYFEDGSACEYSSDKTCSCSGDYCKSAEAQANAMAVKLKELSTKEECNNE